MVCRETFAAFFKIDHGVAAVEFALIFPFLMFLIVATGDVGLALARSLVVERAAQAGAQHAFLHGFSEIEVSDRVESAGFGLGIVADPKPSQTCGCPTASDVEVTACSAVCSSGKPAGTYVQVGAVSMYKPLFPYPLLGETIPLKAVAMIRIR